MPLLMQSHFTYDLGRRYETNTAHDASAQLGNEPNSYTLRYAFFMVRSGDLS
jgi:hypothetical protein